MLVGTLLTVLLQSSSATIALTLLMSANGWIPFEAAAAMVLGENIGTTITANLAAIMGNFRAKQTALAHLIFNFLGVVWMLIAFYPFLKGVVWLAARLGSPSPYLQAAAVPVAISLFHTCFNLVNTLVMIWFVRPISWMVSKIIPEKAPPDRPIEEPKFLTKEALAYPETAIAVVEQESCYLFEHTILEIVAHALSLHQHDVFSEAKSGKVVNKSRKDLRANVRELYLTKVKRIYSEIIAFAVHAQSDLPLSEAQHHRLMEIKLANRRMVVIIGDSNELNRNVSQYLKSPNKVMLGEYDAYRKKIVKALRIIRGVISEEDRAVYEEHLRQLSKQTAESIQAGNLRIDQLIREQQITPEMATSLLNDHETLHSLIENLLFVTGLLYKADGVGIAEASEHRKAVSGQLS
jgi:phosphate:Na+ symporter